jgi:peroxiredoxin
MPNLIGIRLPNITLASTDGRLQTFNARNVLFFYPYTGKPGHPDPENWDNIPGAHGSTPQALAFSMAYEEFSKFDVKIYGISLQTTEWQQEFVLRNKLRFPLLSDADRKLLSALGLESFRAGSNDFLVRRTIIVSNGIITHDFYPIAHPEQNAADVLKALQS